MGVSSGLSNLLLWVANEDMTVYKSHIFKFFKLVDVDIHHHHHDYDHDHVQCMKIWTFSFIFQKSKAYNIVFNCNNGIVLNLKLSMITEVAIPGSHMTEYLNIISVIS
jgi:hypothetical protein